MEMAQGHILIKNYQNVEYFGDIMIGSNNQVFSVSTRVLGVNRGCGGWWRSVFDAMLGCVFGGLEWSVCRVHPS